LRRYTTRPAVKITMRIFLTGVSCIGKTTLGKILAERLMYPFFNLDTETELYFGKSIERLRSRYLTGHSFRYEVGAVVLNDIIFKRDSSDSVISLPPSGLMDAYMRAIRKAAGCLVVAITDTPENILKRITFYDIDSRPIQRELNDREATYQLKEIKKDMTYFGKTYKRAHLVVDIAGQSIEDSVSTIKDTIQSYVPVTYLG
jgi:shikimate kinase